MQFGERSVYFDEEPGSIVQSPLEVVESPGLVKKAKKSSSKTILRRAKNLDRILQEMDQTHTDGLNDIFEREGMGPLY